MTGAAGMFSDRTKWSYTQRSKQKWRY